MKKSLSLLLPFLIPLFFLFSQCKENSSTADHASVVPRGTQPQHLDRFEAEIQAYEAVDKEKIPPKEAVLFIGSSTIRLWSSLETDFLPTTVINRGFGGSTIPEVIYYADRIVFNYQPKMIVFYCGENDIAEGAAPAVVFQNFKKLAGMVQQKLPKTTFVFISLKPSPQRWNLWSQFEQVNSMVEQFIKNQPNFRFADLRGTLKNASGQPDPSLFQPDQLHLNEQGYQKWTERLKPVLEEVMSYE